MSLDSLHLLIFMVILKYISCLDEELGERLGYKEGIVKNESFMYFYIHHLGNIIISLNSTNGDADMYISDRNVFPTYEINSYDLHSATCGIDLIDVPESFASPISVGIYGHPTHIYSDFVLEVYKKATMGHTGSLLLITEEVPEIEDPKEKKSVNDDTDTKQLKSKVKKKSDKVTKKLNGLFSLFEIFQLIFL